MRTLNIDLFSILTLKASFQFSKDNCQVQVHSSKLITFEKEITVFYRSLHFQISILLSNKNTIRFMVVAIYFLYSYLQDRTIIEKAKQMQSSKKLWLLWRSLIVKATLRKGFVMKTKHKIEMK